MPGDIRAALAQVRSILDDIDRDLPPRALKGQEGYDAIVAIIRRDCINRECEDCAFDIPRESRCLLMDDLKSVLLQARGHNGGDAE